ncbi:hypothetical protein J1605_006267 [Eschrichtius robustus]|uniref:Uncharacterized protein n=1 Tax=Eschrichtius robustus TaxID=9764 RepID=A0AB34H519_ESCRO|nr:hypothetical protein J1605_006267 [Eschrichtius robustus]
MPRFASEPLPAAGPTPRSPARSPGPAAPPPPPTSARAAPACGDWLAPASSPTVGVSRSSECGAVARDAASAPAAAPRAREETKPPPAPTPCASRGSYRRRGRRTRRGARGRRRGNGRGRRRGLEGEKGKRGGTDGRTDGPKDGPGRGPPSSLSGPSALARGGRGGGAGEGRGRRYRDNNPAARLRGRRREGGGGLARPRLAQHPGGVFAPRRPGSAAVGCRGARVARSPRLAADAPCPPPPRRAWSWFSGFPWTELDPAARHGRK